MTGNIGFSDNAGFLRFVCPADLGFVVFPPPLARQQQDGALIACTNLLEAVKVVYYKNVPPNFTVTTASTQVAASEGTNPAKTLQDTDRFVVMGLEQEGRAVTLTRALENTNEYFQSLSVEFKRLHGILYDSYASPIVDRDTLQAEVYSFEERLKTVSSLLRKIHGQLLQLQTRHQGEWQVGKSMKALVSLGIHRGQDDYLSGAIKSVETVLEQCHMPIFNPASASDTSVRPQHNMFADPAEGSEDAQEIAKAYKALLAKFSAQVAEEEREPTTEEVKEAAPLNETPNASGLTPSSAEEEEIKEAAPSNEKAQAPSSGGLWGWFRRSSAS